MIVVTHLEGDRFEIAVRNHRVYVDQPLADGGEDTAPTPTELFVSSLAACVAFYAGRYLTRHGLPTDGLGAEADYGFAKGPTRVGQVTVRLRVPEAVPEDKWAALLAVASHCTVHNTLDVQPVVSVELLTAERAAA
ncbi:MAG TPA: OsmC family protein [Acidimicrobiales bacterium]|jgi:putative redox protein|nr:OsmC family protein [Acidimicrobiales bacterium]